MYILLFFYTIITVLSRKCVAETQYKLCEYVKCPEIYSEFECISVDQGLEKFEGNINAAKIAKFF